MGSFCHDAAPVNSSSLLLGPSALAVARFRR
jgi:hypothetical protein